MSRHLTLKIEDTDLDTDLSAHYCIGYDTGFYTYVNIGSDSVELTLDGATWSVNPENTQVNAEDSEKILQAWKKFIAAKPEQILAAKRAALKEALYQLTESIKSLQRQIKDQIRIINDGELTVEYKQGVDAALQPNIKTLETMQKVAGFLQQELDILDDPKALTKRLQGANNIRKKFPWLAKSK